MLKGKLATLRPFRESDLERIKPDKDHEQQKL